jgi:hypothetical protein
MRDGSSTARETGETGTAGKSGPPVPGATPPSSGDLKR